MPGPLDTTLASNRATAYVPRVVTAAAHGLKYWVQNVVSFLATSLQSLGQRGAAANPAAAAVAQPQAVAPMGASARAHGPQHLATLRCAETGRDHPQLPLERVDEFIGLKRVMDAANHPGSLVNAGGLQVGGANRWDDAFQASVQVNGEPRSVLPQSLLTSSLLNRELDEQVLRVNAGRSDSQIEQDLHRYETALDPNQGIRQPRQIKKDQGMIDALNRVRNLRAGTAEPAKGQVVKGFQNTLLDPRTGFVASISVKNGREVQINFSCMGSQGKRVRQGFRCFFEVAGLWTPKNFAQASKLTQMVKAHVEALNKDLPEDQKLSVTLAGHSMGGGMATYSALRNKVPATVINPLHLGLATRAKVGLGMMKEAPKWVTEVAVQGDWVSDNAGWKSKALSLWSVPSVLLTGSTANNRGAIGQRYLVPAPTSQQLSDYAQRKWPGDGNEDNARWAANFDRHNEIEVCLRIHEEASRGGASANSLQFEIPRDRFNTEAEPSPDQIRLDQR